MALAGPAAAAEPTPVAPVAAPVTADALPTWQINGVVWSQVIVGNTVYATGSFTKARPPGVALGGAGEVDALNIFAYDLTTGNRVASFNHALNGQGLVARASADGSRVIVGGDFTTVDGVARGHVAAFSTADGSLLSWAPNVGGQVRAVAATPSTVYVGGSFPSANGAARAALAAFSSTSNTMLPWAPAASGSNASVMALLMSPDQSRVIVGGSFEHAQRGPRLRHGFGRRHVRCHPAVGRQHPDPHGRPQRWHHQPQHRRHAGLRHGLRVRQRRHVRGQLLGRPVHRRHQLGQRLPR